MGIIALYLRLLLCRHRRHCGKLAQQPRFADNTRAFIGRLWRGIHRRIGLKSVSRRLFAANQLNAVCCFIHYRFVVFGADGPIRHIARAAPVGISPPKNQRPVAKHADWRRRCFNLRDRVFVIIILGTCVCQLIGF